MKDGPLAWVKPYVDYVKVNNDAAILADKGCSGLVLVARDGRGLWLNLELFYGLVWWNLRWQRRWEFNTPSPQLD